MEANANLSTHHPQGKESQYRREALTRAVSGQSLSNFPAIYQGFAAKGIPESEIKPRENAIAKTLGVSVGTVHAAVQARSKISSATAPVND